MPIVTVVCALAGTAKANAVAAVAAERRKRIPGLRRIADLQTMADLSVVDAPRA
jgi:hypothetical protein